MATWACSEGDRFTQVSLHMSRARVQKRNSTPKLIICTLAIIMPNVANEFGNHVLYMKNGKSKEHAVTMCGYDDINLYNICDHRIECVIALFIINSVLNGAV